MKTGHAITEMKQWLTELGIDSSNLEELIAAESAENARSNIVIAHDDSKGKSFLRSNLMKFLYSVATIGYDA